MIGDRLTQNLEKLLNSDTIIANDKEMEDMAKITGNRDRDNRKEEDIKEEDVKVDEAKEEQIADAADTVQDILNQAKADLDKKEQESGGINRTSNYVPGQEDTDINEEGMTEEEKQIAREKQIAAERRRTRAIEHNQFIESNMAEISSTLGDAEISDQHNALQIACREYGRHEGFLMAEGERTNLRVARSFVKDKNKSYVFKGNVAPDVKEELGRNQLRKDLQKGDLVEYKMSLKYTMSAPKNQFGSVISIPEVLNISVLNLKSGNFETPTKEEIKASNKMVFTLGTEAFFTYLTLYFGGEIRENDAVLETKAKVTSEHNWLEGNVTIVSVEDKLTRKQARSIRKRITSKCRTSVYIPENIIPFKVYESEAIDRLDNETQLGYTSALTKALSSGKELKAKYKYLDDKSKAILQGRMTPDEKELEELTIGFFNGSFIPGEGDAADLGLTHWANHARMAAGTYEKVAAPARLTKLYENVSSSGNRTYKPFVKLLGLDIQLTDLATMGYPAAGRVAKMGITENDISLLMEDHKKELKAKRDAAALADPNRSNKAKTVSRRSGDLKSKVATNLFFQNLIGDVNTDGLDINVESVKDELITLALRS